MDLVDSPQFGFENSKLFHTVDSVHHTPQVFTAIPPRFTAERDRYKKLVNKSESSLNTANSTIDGLSVEIKRMQLKFGKNSADAGGGTIAHVPPPNTSSEPAPLQAKALGSFTPAPHPQPAGRGGGFSQCKNRNS